jgi:hypothetical protein
MGLGTTTGNQRTAETVTAKHPDAWLDLNQASVGPEAALNRRGFLSFVGAMVTTAALGQVSAQEPLPAPPPVSGASPATGPGLDKPMEIGTYRSEHDFLFQGISRVEVEKMRAALGDKEYKDHLNTAPGGVLYAVALDLDKIGRDNIPPGYGIQISVTSSKRLHPQTGEPLTENFVINPRVVPASQAVHQSTFRQAVNGDRDLKRFVDALGATNDPLQLGVGVRVSKIPGDDKNLQFQFITREGKPATMTMQVVPLEKK